MFLRDQGIDENNSGFGIARRAGGLSNSDGGVGRGIRDASEGLETTMEAAGARKRS